MRNIMLMLAATMTLMALGPGCERSTPTTSGDAANLASPATVTAVSTVAATAATATTTTAASAAAPGRTLEEIKMKAESIHWYGHDAFRIEDAGRQLYFDPWKLPADAPKADYIFVTHVHHDHFSPEDIEKIRQAGTKIVAPADVAEKIGSGATVIAPGQTLTLDKLQVRAVAAYNIGKKFHLPTSRWVGYVVTLSDGLTVYQAGDTDATPEMQALAGIDLALLPVSGTYVMTADEAAAAANVFKPRAVIPMHYGTIVGTPDDADKFKAAFRGETLVKTAEK